MNSINHNDNIKLKKNKFTVSSAKLQSFECKPFKQQFWAGELSTFSRWEKKLNTHAPAICAELELWNYALARSRTEMTTYKAEKHSGHMTLEPL